MMVGCSVHKVLLWIFFASIKAGMFMFPFNFLKLLCRYMVPNPLMINTVVGTFETLSSSYPMIVSHYHLPSSISHVVQIPMIHHLQI